ncbi:MAG: hypothetical protein J6C90_01555 [Clostridia bacterium]|nr:hypothetical protein [Clostridia bacterium]
MFLNKKLRQLDKKITSESVSVASDSQDTIIHVKVNSIEQVMSKFNYDCDDKLNPEFSEYLRDKANQSSLKDNLQIDIHTDQQMNGDEVSNAIKHHYAREYAVAKKELNRSTRFSLIMLLCGLVSLCLTFLIYSYDVQYFGLIMEIVAWVFLWEAADRCFIERARQKRECILLQKLYSAKLNITKQHKKRTT